LTKHNALRMSSLAVRYQGREFVQCS
jgi:hypothetical protein